MKKLRVFTAAVLALLFALSAAGCDNGRRGKYSDPVEFERAAHAVSVFFVNAGKADCAIVLVDSHAWLVDAGEEESFVNVFSALELLNVKQLDGVILTHGHSDHIGGLEPIAQKYPIGQVVTSALLIDSSFIDDIGFTAETVTAGQSISITEGVAFEVMAPLSLNTKDDNDNSLVLMLRVNGRRFLFTGDMQFEEDAELVASGQDIACDVLKVPNHGNPDATGEAFAKAADPLIAVISTDTKVDEDSANRIVRAKLKNAEIFLTEEHPLGVLVTVSERGEIAVSFPERPAPSVVGLRITEASKAHQAVVITNEGGEEVSLAGCFVWSTKGCEIFAFPDEAALEPGTSITLKPGCSITIAATKSDIAGSADYLFPFKKVFADSKEDIAVLCDAYGNELSRLESR